MMPTSPNDRPAPVSLGAVPGAAADEPLEESEARASDGRVPGRRGMATRQRLLECTGRMLRSSAYRDIKVVDIARAGVLGVLGMPTQTRYGMLSGLAFTADGASLAVAYPAYPDQSGSGELDVYDLAPDRLVQAACATAGRDLTAAEWRQFVNDAVPDDLRCTP